MNNPELDQIEGSSHCGGRPKKIAFGIAPFGYISIGIVPMGIVTIGVVPMGVVSLGVVAMGVINASIVGMGIFSAGITTMGLKVWSPVGPSVEQKINRDSSFPSKNIFAYPSKAKAEQEAKKLGCIGVHKMGNLWMPCATHGVTH
tara:strand:- start:4182 stop:4616 length:435 start_codon:yes stop_codon:yes gene_type:complete